MESEFKFPMRVSERVLGLVYLVLHAFVLPLVITDVYAALLRRVHVAPTAANLNLFYYIVGFVFVMVFLFRFLRASFSDLIDNPLGALKAVLLGFVFNYAALIAVSLLLVTLFGSAVNPNSQEVVNQTKLAPNTILVLAVLLVPIVEETLFRGALFGTLRTKSRLLAYIVSSALFAVYHLWQYFFVGFDWRLLVYLLQYIPAALALGWVYEKSGSIWAPIFLHALINFISIRLTLV